MAYKALTYINLPYIEVLKEPGDTITKQEFKDAEQTNEDIAELLKWGSISEDMDAPIHPDNEIPDPDKPTLQTAVSQAQALVEELKSRGETVPPELKAVAELDYQAIMTKDRTRRANERASRK